MHKFINNFLVLSVFFLQFKNEIKVSSSITSSCISPKKIKIELPDIEDADLMLETKIEKWEPANWKRTLDNIRQMRQSQSAPVDTMGCHKCSDETADEKVYLIFFFPNSQEIIKF